MGNHYLSKINVRFFKDDGTPDVETAKKIYNEFSEFIEADYEGMSVKDGLITSEGFFYDEGVGGCLKCVLDKAANTNYKGIYIFKSENAFQADVIPFFSDIKLKNENEFGMELKNYFGDDGTFTANTKFHAKASGDLEAKYVYTDLSETSMRNISKEELNATEIIISESVTEITKKMLSLYKNAQSLKLPQSVKIIEEKCFGGKSKISDIFYEGTKAQWIFSVKGAEEIPSRIQIHCSDGTPEPLPSNIEDLIVPEDVTEIYPQFMCLAKKLKSIKFPSSLKIIGWSAFGGCPNLKSVDFSEGLVEIQKQAFIYTNLPSLSLPSTIKTIGYEAFMPEENTSSSLTTVHFAGTKAQWQKVLNSSKKEHKCWFMYLPAKEIECSNGTVKFPDYIINNDVLECVSPSLTEIEIPEGVKKIGADSFNTRMDGEESKIKKVSIPNTVIEIGRSAFYGCKELKEITIPDSVEIIEDFAFCMCKALESIKLPEKIKKVGNDAFTSCFSLKSISIPDSLTEISADMFSACLSLEAIEIPDTISVIKPDAFASCESLKSVKIGSGVTIIYNYAFRNCTSLESISLPDGLTKIGGYTFENCTALNAITIPESVTEIGFRAFEKCNKLTINYKGTKAQWDALKKDDTLREESSGIKVSFLRK